MKKYGFYLIIILTFICNLQNNAQCILSFHKRAILELHKVDLGPSYSNNLIYPAISENIYFIKGNYTFSYLLDKDGYCIVQLISGGIDHINPWIKSFQQDYVKLSDSEWLDYSNKTFKGIVSYKIISMDKDGFIIRITDKEISDMLK